MKHLRFSTVFIYRINEISQHGLQCLSAFKLDIHFQLSIWVIAFAPCPLLCPPVLPQTVHWPFSKDNMDLPTAMLMLPWAMVIHAWICPPSPLECQLH